MRARRSSALVAGVAGVALLAGATAGVADTPDGATPHHVETAPLASNDRRVILVSLDGLHRAAIKKLGRKGAPTLHRILRRGASTLNARTLRERTVTMPNHTAMITGRRVNEKKGGHGVWINHDPGGTVSDLAGEPVSSVFDVVHDAGGSTALFTSKDKFKLFERSWSASIDRFTYKAGNKKLAKAVVRDLDKRRAFTMLHLSAPDAAGHKHGFMTKRYLKKVKRTDRNLGFVIDALRSDAELAAHTVVLVTADHGGEKKSRRHSAVGKRANFTVPVMAWGDGVARGDLYALNPAFKNPRKKRTTYAGKQPIRNGMVANLATSLLGLDAVPGSTLDPKQRLDVLD